MHPGPVTDQPGAAWNRAVSIGSCAAASFEGAASDASADPRRVMRDRRARFDALRAEGPP